MIAMSSFVRWVIVIMYNLWTLAYYSTLYINIFVNMATTTNETSEDYITKESELDNDKRRQILTMMRIKLQKERELDNDKKLQEERELEEKYDHEVEMISNGELELVASDDADYEHGGTIYYPKGAAGDYDVGIIGWYPKKEEGVDYKDMKVVVPTNITTREVNHAAALFCFSVCCHVTHDCFLIVFLWSSTKEW
jgi:hypothetical protein